MNGWELSGIVRFNSGKPFDVLMTTDVAGLGAGFRCLTARLSAAGRRHAAKTATNSKLSEV